MVRFLPLLLLLLPQDPPKEPKPTLPEPRRVTLKLDKVPLPEAIAKFSEASTFVWEYQRNRYQEEEPKREVTVDLKDVPLVLAVREFSLAAVLNFDVRNGTFTEAYEGLVAVTTTELFGVGLLAVQESLRTDFASERRMLRIPIVLWNQPDFPVFRTLGITVEGAVDDAGSDLRSGEQKDVNAIVLKLPTRQATTIAVLKGTIEVEVPGDVIECSIKDVAAAAIEPRTVDEFLLTGSRSDLEAGPRWQVTVARVDKKPCLGLTEPRTVRRDDTLAGITFLRSATLNFHDAPNGGATELRFKIVKSVARAIIPFEFKNVKLAR